MILKELSWKNYKDLPNTTLTFKEGVNILTGMNGVGKTGVRDAITIALFGRTCWDTNPVGTRADTDDAMEIYLTFVFSRENEPTREYKIRRKVSASTSTLSLADKADDGWKILPQSDFDSRIGMTFKTFNPIFNPAWFFERKANEKKELILQYVQRPDKKAILQELLGPNFSLPILEIGNTKKELTRVTDLRRKKHNEYSAAEGTACVLRPEVDTMLAFINANAASEASLREELSKTRSDIETWKRHAEESAKISDEDAKKIEADLEKSRVLYSETVTKITTLENELKELTPKERALADEMSVITMHKLVPLQRPTPRHMPPMPTSSKLPEGTCPTCGQVVAQKHRDAMNVAQQKQMNEYENLCASIKAQNEKELAEWTSACAEITKKNVVQDEALTSVRVKRNELIAEINNLETQLGFLRKSKDTIILNGKKLGEALAKRAGAVPSVAGLRPVEALSKREDEISEILNTLQMYSKGYPDKKEHLVKADATMASLSAEVDALSRYELALKDLPDLEFQKIKAQLEDKDISVSFTDDDCDITYKGKDYYIHSAGNRILACFALSKFLRDRIATQCECVFVDDVNLVHQFRDQMKTVKLPPQVFVAEVSETELMVTYLEDK